MQAESCKRKLNHGMPQTVLRRFQERVENEFLFSSQGLARTQSPTTKNYAPELPTFGVIARVSPTEVQWKGLALRGPP